jgi:hypothetical protein
MKSTFVSAVVSLSLLTSIAVFGMPGRVAAQQVVAPGWANIPGLGPVKLRDLPPELRDNIRVPGGPADEPEAELDTAEDLSAENLSTEETTPLIPGHELDAPQQTESLPDNTTPLTVSEPPWPRNDKERAQRDEAVRQMYPPEKENGSFLPPRPRERPLPEDAYIRAQEQSERLRSGASNPPAATPEPESWLPNLNDTFASLDVPFAHADTGQCSSAPSWAPAGPAPIEIYNSVVPGVVKNAGIIKAIAIKPTAPSQIHLGSRGGGLWSSTNGGVTWSTATDNLPAPNKTSLHIETILPENNVVLAGTGLNSLLVDGALNTELDRSIGTLRSVNGASGPYEQVGPAWCTTTDSACRNGSGVCTQSNPGLCPGTNPTNSTINVRQLSIDKTTSTTRIWAATSKGLWWSENALTAGSASAVTWTLVTPPGSCSSNCLPGANSTTPESINNVLVSPLRDPGTNAFVVYASVQSLHTPANNGWYRSVDQGASWAKVVNGLPTNPIIQRSVIAQGGVSGSDTLYATVENVATLCDGVNSNRRRVYRSTNSGTSWSLVDMSVGSSQTCEGQPCNPDCYDGYLVIEVHPTDANRVTFGGIQLHEVTNVASPQQTVRRLGYGIIHGDQNALAYHPTNSNILFVGNDGGIWSGNLGASPPTWTFLHGNLANLEFYGGTVAPLNYGLSFGGTQDNGDLKVGSGPAVWRGVIGGDGAQVISDPRDSNIEYHNHSSNVKKTVNGGDVLEITNHHSGLPTNQNGAVDVSPLAMDPTDNKTIVTYSRLPNEKRFYRTITAAEEENPPNPAWTAISPSLNLAVNSFAIPPAASTSPRSDIIYAGTYGSGLQRTTNALNWSQIDQTDPQGRNQIPHFRTVTSVAIDTSLSCPSGQQLCSDACACTMYVTSGNPAAGGEIPGSVFRSTDSGRNWTQMSGNCDATHLCADGQCPSGGVCTGGLPNYLAMNRLVIAPDNPDVIYVASDMGVYQGTRSGTTWSWCAYSNGFPKTATVDGLVAHADSGLLRAFTYGRSAWDAPAFTVPNPDQKVNTTAPVTSASVPRISSANDGAHFAVGWVDDRSAALNFHAYLRAFEYGANGQPSALGTADLRVDDTSAHSIGTPALAAHPTQTSTPYCARLAWSDNRLGSTASHIYFQYACSNGYKLYVSDVRADTASSNAWSPAITFQDDIGFSVSWHADRGTTGKHDLYVRFFNFIGTPLTNPLKANTSTGDAMLPSAGTDSANNTYLAWQEDAAAVVIRKYDSSGNPLIAPVIVAGATSGVTRQNVAIAVPKPSSTPTVVVSWIETLNGGSEKIVARQCDSALSNCTAVLDAQCDRRCAGGPNAGRSCAVDSSCPQSTCTQTAGTVSCPPLEPPGVQRAWGPAAAIDSGGNPILTWQANVNDRTSTVWSAMARSFSPSLGVLKNDFRVDLAGRADVRAPAVARGNQANKAVFAWRDKRSGKYEIYTRAVPIN